MNVGQSEDKPVIPMKKGAFIIVCLSAVLAPGIAAGIQTAAKIEALVLRGVDVTGPEQADIVIVKGMLSSSAAEAHVNIMRGDQGESSPAFEMVDGSGGLI